MGHAVKSLSLSPTRLTLSDTLRAARQRFMTNARNPIVRRNITFLMAGKMVGLMIVLMLMKTFIATGLDIHDHVMPAYMASSPAGNG